MCECEPWRKTWNEWNGARRQIHNQISIFWRKYAACIVNRLNWIWRRVKIKAVSKSNPFSFEISFKICMYFFILQSQIIPLEFCLLVKKVNNLHFISHLLHHIVTMHTCFSVLCVEEKKTSHESGKNGEKKKIDLISSLEEG